jgi:hypothetical protein
MKTVRDIKALFRNAAISTGPAADQAVLTDALQAGGLTSQKRPARNERTIWRFLMESRVTKLAAAGVVLAAAITGIHHLNGTVVKAVEFSEITRAMAEVPWMHASAVGYGRSVTGLTEFWIGFDARVGGGRMPDGKVSFCRLREHERTEYDPNSNAITLSYVKEEEFSPQMSSPVLMLESMHKLLKDQGAEIVVKMGDYQGRKVQVQEITLSKPGEGIDRYAATLYVDPQSKLLQAIESAALDANGVAVMTAGIALDYPQAGPQSIYDLGVPRDARIIDNMPPREFRAIWEQYEQVRAEATDRYVAVITHATYDGIITMIDVDSKSGRKHRQERHFVFHPGEILNQFWPTYKEQMGKSFESLLAWTRRHYDERGSIAIYLYDGRYDCSTDRDDDGPWSKLKKDPSTDDGGPLTALGDLAWPHIGSQAQIVVDDYSREHNLVCIETLSQGQVMDGWVSLPGRFLHYLDPQRDYICCRRVLEWCPDAPWQKDKNWLAGVDPGKVRDGSISVHEITEAFQAADGRWYPRTIAERSTGIRKDYKEAALRTGAIKHIYLTLSPEFDEGTFDVGSLPGQ